MKIVIRNSKDFYAGIIFMFFGFLTIFEAYGYQIGTARRMGPGYFPIVLGGILVLIGMIITINGLWSKGDTIKLSLRPLLVVCSGILAFAFLIRPAGLVLATFALVFISCLAGWKFRFLEVLALSLLLVAMTIGIFVFSLGLPLKLFWSR